MSNTAGRQLAAQISATIATAHLVVADQVERLGRQLDHADAATAELRRDLAIERARSRAVSEALGRIVEGMAQPGSIHPDVTALRGRLLHIDVDGNGQPTTPKLVREFITGGHALPYWTVGTIAGQRVRLADGRRGIVHDAFGTDVTGVESITVQPVTGPVSSSDLVYDLHPRDVEFVDHR